MSQNNEGIYSPTLLRSVVWIAVVAFLICLAIIFKLLALSDFELNISSAGSAGDFFGGWLNPIIAFLGMILLAMTLRQNSIALKLTHEELEKSTEQMKLSAQALQKQEDLMRVERLESLLIKITEKMQHDFLLPFADPSASSTRGQINSKAEAVKRIFSSLDSEQDVKSILKLLDRHFGQDHLYFHTIRKLVKEDDDVFKFKDEKLLLPASVINTNYLMVSALIIHHRMISATSNFVHFDDNRVYDMLVQMIRIAGAEYLWKRIFERFKNY